MRSESLLTKKGSEETLAKNLVLVTPGVKIGALQEALRSSTQCINTATAL